MSPAREEALQGALAGPAAQELYGNESVAWMAQNPTGARVPGVDAVGRWADRNAHMADQDLGIWNGIKRLVQDGKLPAETLSKYRDRVTNVLYRAERMIHQARNDRGVQEYLHKWAAVPPEWSEALQMRRDGGDFKKPEGKFHGGTWDEFAQETDELYGRAARSYNEEAKRYGLEGMDVRPDAAHPSQWTGRGAHRLGGNIYYRWIDAVMNTPGALIGRDKGFFDLDQIAKDIREAAIRNVRVEDGKYILDKRRWNYLASSGGEDKFGPKILGRTKSGDFIVADSPDGFSRFLEEEPARFKSAAASFRNVGKEEKAIAAGDSKPIERQFPYLPSAHKASPFDFAQEARATLERAASLRGQNPGFLQDITSLAAEIKRSNPGDLEVARVADAIANTDPTKGPSVTSLEYRAKQQRGQIVNPGNFLTRVDEVWRPVASDLALAMNSMTAAAKQPFQIAGQAGARGGIKGLAKHAALTAESAAKHLGSYVGLADKENRLHQDPTRTAGGSLFSGFGLSSAIGDKVLERDLPALVGDLVTNRPEMAARMYSDAELDALRAATKDGLTDLSDPHLRDLADNVKIRHGEVSNGVDLNTSKPAFFQHNALARSAGLFLPTPATISKSTLSLYRAGGLMDQGSDAANVLARRRLGYVLGGYAASNAVQASGLLKAIALLSSGAVLPAAFKAVATTAAGPTGSEEKADSRQKLAMHILRNVGSASAAERAYAALYLMSMVQPVGFDLQGALDKLLAPGDQNLSKIKPYREEGGALNTLSRLAPAPFVPIQKAAQIAGAVADHASGERLFPNGLLYHFASQNSEVPFISDISPLKEGVEVDFKRKGIRPMTGAGGVPSLRKVKGGTITTGD